MSKSFPATLWAIFKVFIVVSSLLLAWLISIDLQAQSRLSSDQIDQGESDQNSNLFPEFKVAQASASIQRLTQRSQAAIGPRGSILHTSLISPAWVYRQKLTVSGSVDGSALGQVIDLSGETLIAGMVREQSFAGAAYIFQRSYGPLPQWTLLKKLVATDTLSHNFGKDVSIDDKVALIGAPGADGGFGAAYIFERNVGGPNHWGQVIKLTAFDGIGGNYFGSGVSVSGDTVAVGAVGHLDGLPRRGGIYIFERNEGGLDHWGLVIKLDSPPTLPSSYGFGEYIRLSGDNMLVGTGGVGGVYIYGRNVGGANGWGLVKVLTPTVLVPLPAFGLSADISAETAVVGAYHEDGHEADAVYIYGRSHGGPDYWGLIKKLVPADIAGADQFGSVSLSGDRIVIRTQHLGTGALSILILERDAGGDNNWGIIQTLPLPSSVDQNQTYANLKIDANTIAAGDQADDETGLNTGAIYLYSRENLPPIANDDPITVVEGSVLVAIGVLDNDTDPEHDQLAIGDIGTPDQDGVAVISGTEVISYTPAVNFYGTETLVYTVTDGNGGYATATVTVTVTPTNQEPIAVDDAAITLDHEAVIVKVLDNDRDADGDSLSISAIGQSRHGSTISSGQGGVIYTPSSGFAGTDSFTYTVTDGHTGNDTALVTISVITGDEAEVVTSDDQTTIIHADQNGDQTVINVPSGAVSQTIYLVYTELDTHTMPLPQAFRSAGQSFTLDAYLGDQLQSDFVFNSPVTITLEYDAAAVNGLNEAALDVRSLDEDIPTWTPDGITIVQRDLVNNRITFTLEHLTEFGLMAQASLPDKLYIPIVFND